MKILVTGGGGFVGNVLCRELLNRGYKIRCMDNFHKGQCDALLSLVPNEDFEFMYGDVTKHYDCKQAVKDTDGIIHLAAIVGFPACKRHPSLAEMVNVNGTLNMLKVYDNRPFVFASTGSVYGAVANTCTEETPTNCQSLYGTTKREAEFNVLLNSNTVSFRFATGFGVSPCMRVNLLVNDFVYKAKTDGCLVVFQADFRRTFIHVRDMAKTFYMGLEGLLEKKLAYNLYNAGANNLNWTKRDLAEYISKKTKCLVHYAEIGKDVDQRDYEVSYDRWHKEGFKPDYNMKKGIDELIKVTPLLQIRHQYE